MGFVTILADIFKFAYISQYVLTWICKLSVHTYVYKGKEYNERIFKSKSCN